MRKLKHFAILLCLFACLSAQAGQVTGVIQSAGGVALSNATLTWTPTQFAVVAGQFVQTAQSVNCYTDGLGNIVGIGNPLVLPLASSGPLGSLTPGNYYIQITYTASGGLETAASPELLFNLTSNRIVITAPVLQPANATGYNVYIGTVSGGETLQIATVGFGNTVINGLIGSVSPPANNTTCTFNFSDSLIPQARYVLSMVDSNGSSVPGWPQTYYTQGATFNLNTAFPTNGTTAIFSNAIVSTPSSGATQSILGGLNLNGFGLTAGSVTNSGNETVGGNETISGNLIAPQVNKHIYVDGTKYPVTQVGIQAALTDACAVGNPTGTDVYLPVGTTVTVTNTTAQQFLITCPLQIHGAGVNQFWFVYGGSAPSGVPLFRVKPSVADNGWYGFDNFRVTSGGAVGGDVIFLDSTNAGINHLRIHDVAASGMANTSWFLNMSASVADRYFFGHLWDNQIEGGINLNSTSTSDSWLFEHNTFGAATGNVNPCLNATTEIGSSHFTMFNNNGGCAGGFFISHGTTQPKILYNQIEQPVASTEANSAIIDLIGDTYTIDGAEIRGNNINQHAFATNGIRINAATNTKIAANVISVRPTTGVGIVLTGSSSGTFIDGTNEITGTGGGAVAMTNASGANPFCVPLFNATGLLAAQLCNDSAGGFQIITNNGKSWDFQNTSNLVTPAGVGITYSGGSSGSIITLPPNVAGNNTITWPAQTGTPDVSVGQIDLTAQTAAQTTTTLLAVTNAGQYLFAWNAKVTSVGTTSTLGPMTLTYTDPDNVTITTVVSATQAAGGITVTGANTNTTSTFLIGTPLMINVKAGTNVQVAFAYASTGSAMQYNLHEKLVAF